MIFSTRPRSVAFDFGRFTIDDLSMLKAGTCKMVTASAASVSLRNRDSVLKTVCTVNQQRDYH
jgi:hypothetical protein